MESVPDLAVTGSDSCVGLALDNLRMKKNLPQSWEPGIIPQQSFEGLALLLLCFDLVSALAMHFKALLTQPF